MDSERKDELYSDNYKVSDFVWGVTLGEGKYTIHIFPLFITFLQPFIE